MTRTPLQQLARAALIGVPILVSPLVSAGASLGMVAVALLIAYDGIFRHAIWRALGCLFIVELVAGMSLGVLVVPYLVACLVWYVAQRGVPLVPWSSVDGWRIGDAGRTITSAAVLWAVMTVVAVAVQVVFYDRGAMLQRLALAFGDVPPAVLAAFGIGMLMLLRRVDAPFRTQVHFGT